jgi:hypothetical protein
MRQTISRRTLILLAIATILTIGCSDSDRVARVATEAARQQAKQNEEMARLNREIAEGTKRLVEADAEARSELTEMQHDVQTERAKVSEQRDRLETERQAIANQRLTESKLGPILKSCSAAALCVVTIGFCWYLLFGLRQHDNSDQILKELLVEELASESPALLPSPRTERIALPTDERDPQRLPTPD